MIRFLFVFNLLFCFLSYGKQRSSILNFLKDKNSTSPLALDKLLKKNIASLLPSSAQEHIELSQAFEAKDYKKTLKLWSADFDQTDFAQSSTGRALHAFLLFKNGFVNLGLKKLFKEVNPKQVDSLVYNLWKLHTHSDQKVWDYFIHSWSPQWSPFFDEKIAFKLGSKKPLSLTGDKEYIERLLNLPVSEKEDKFNIQWALVLYLINSYNMSSATQSMSWLLKNTKDQDRKNIIYLTIARLLYDIQEAEVALQYYRLVKGHSYLWLQAQEEQAWIYYNQGNFSQALELTSAFHYPKLKNMLSPDMSLILALSQLKNCDYSNLSQSLSWFKNHFTQRQTYLKNLKTNSFWEKVAQDVLKYHTSPQEIKNIANLSFTLKNNIYLKNLVQWKQFLIQSSTDWPRQGIEKSNSDYWIQYVIQEHAQFIAELNAKIKNIIQKNATKELNHIQRVAYKMNLVEVDALYRIHGYHNQKSLLPQAFKTSFSRKGQTVSFPFNSQEVWLDEISQYHFSPSKQCPRKSYVL